MSHFKDLIKKFNDIYKLPSNDNIKYLGSDRLKNFKNILLEEIDEIDEIITSMIKYETNKEENDELLIDNMVELSDLLGDVVVYCFSEMRRWGIDPDSTYEIIMNSNFSKLDKNGNPMYDDRGKVLKGPYYYPPSKLLKETIIKSYQKSIMDKGEKC